VDYQRPSIPVTCVHVFGDLLEDKARITVHTLVGAFQESRILDMLTVPRYLEWGVCRRKSLWDVGKSHVLCLPVVPTAA
jgi:hypothetical protein